MQELSIEERVLKALLAIYAASISNEFVYLHLPLEILLYGQVLFHCFIAHLCVIVRC